MKQMLKEIVTHLLRIFLRLFRIVKLKNNRIVFEAYDGKNYSCNPRYISEYLNQEYPDLFQKYWVYQNKPFDIQDHNVLQIKRNSLNYCYYMLTSKIIIVNSGIPRYLPFRTKQIIINTWHGGGAYKKNFVSAANQQLYNKQITHFISSSELFETYVIRESFGFQGTVLKFGMPRNDLLYQNPAVLSKAAQSSLGITKKCALYAPTWRKNKNMLEFGLDYAMLKKALEKKLGGEWIILKRLHHEMNTQNINENPNFVIDVGAYPDMQELLAFSDVLITDYSSTIWDYSILRKPCFLYVPDLSSYKNERDFYIDIHEWPFALAENNAELCKCIQEFEETAYLKKIDAHHKLLGSYEQGNACQQTADFIINNYSQHS
ncbi:MAG: hypothetical protein HFH28_11715 [Clostridiaceae bacterium]|nr:hypothetical protein [Lachnospiraceae bacterium]MCI8881373.1 hypothetical protein [Clostridiaceae bacterium]